MEEITYRNGYQEYRKELRTELEKTSEGFVRIGYLLKIARDTDILKDSGYKDYLEFAQGEYGLDKSQVSRFVRINDRFSEGGSSDRLLEQYKGFGYAKLSIMLTMPEVITEELTPDLTKSEISEIKEQIDEEKAISDIEHFTENAAEILNPPDESLIVQTIREIGCGYLNIYVSIFNDYMCIAAPGHIRIKNIMMPSAPTIYKTRVKGRGNVILVLKDDEASITEVRTEEKTMVTWDEIVDAWTKVIKETGDPYETAQESWSRTYGEPFPEYEQEETSESAINTQSEEDSEEEAKEEPREELKQKPKDEPNQKPNQKPKQQVSKEKVAPVQPKRVNSPREKPAPIEEISAESSSLDPNVIRGYKAGLSNDIHTIERLLKENQYKAIKTKLESMLTTVNRIIESQEVKDE